MKLFRGLALLSLVSLCAIAQNAALMPVPRQQFFDANGVPLAGGYIYTCVAGASCPGSPLATYTDVTGLVQQTNPIQLDASGSPTSPIFLGYNSYKILAKDSSGLVTQWTIDNVYIPGLSLIAGAVPITSITVSSNASIGGNLSVTGGSTFTGAVTLGSTLTVGGLLSGSSITTSGAVSVGSTLGVTGATTLASVTVTGNASVGGTLTVTGAAQASEYGLNDGTDHWRWKLGAATHGPQLEDVTNGTIPITVSPSTPTNTLQLNTTNIIFTLVPEFAGTNSTGATAAALGSNCPASSCTQPYRWIQIKTADGSTAYVPAWK